MLANEEMLFDEYKKVDNICRDMFLSPSGISQYITEMEQNSSYGYTAVPLWDRDYRRLKRVRWLRNQIAHESFTTDCNEEDVAWLEEFHSRLLEQQDPLALLGKKNREGLSFPSRREGSQKVGPEQRASKNAQLQGKDDFSSKRIVVVLIGVTAVLVWLATTVLPLFFNR